MNGIVYDMTQTPDESVHTETVDIHPTVTIGINVAELLRSELGWQDRNTGSWDDPDFEQYPGGNGRIIDLVADKLAGRIEKPVREAVAEAVKQRALAKVDELIDNVMDGTVPTTNAFGETKAPDQTLREFMVKAMTDRLNSHVDSSGRRGDRGYGAKSYLEWHVDKIAGEVLDRQMNSQLSEASRKIKEKASALVAAKVAKVLDIT